MGGPLLVGGLGPGPPGPPPLNPALLHFVPRTCEVQSVAGPDLRGSDGMADPSRNLLKNTSLS